MMNNTLDHKKVVLGLSGGVDSTTAALLLKKSGYDVTGLYFDVLGNNETGRAKAEHAANQSGIDFVYMDMSSEFNNIVINDFCNCYKNGRTPNPCIMCNPNVKFKVLTEMADNIGAYYIATGHYGNAIYDQELQSYLIRRGSNISKDQTYMLYRLPQSTIQRFLMPLEGYDSKDEVREIARTWGMDNSEDKDSQEICFIEPGHSYKDYLQQHNITTPCGNFIDTAGNILGQHCGISNFTVGQRKGLGITFGKPMFVLGTNATTNEVILGSNEELFSDRVISCDNFFPMTGNNTMPDYFTNKVIQAKVRYTSKLVNARINQSSDGSVETVFEEPQRAVTPGQSVVFYYKDLVIGGGFIK